MIQIHSTFSIIVYRCQRQTWPHPLTRPLPLLPLKVPRTRCHLYQNTPLVLAQSSRVWSWKQCRLQRPYWILSECETSPPISKSKIKLRLFIMIVVNKQSKPVVLVCPLSFTFNVPNCPGRDYEEPVVLVCPLSFTFLVYIPNCPCRDYKEPVVLVYPLPLTFGVPNCRGRDYKGTFRQ